jgi:O-antigen ligase
MQKSEVTFMNSQNLVPQVSGDTVQKGAVAEDAETTRGIISQASDSPPISNARLLKGLTPFWHDRIIEVGLVLSMAMYYIVGNVNLGTGRLFHLNPLFSLPFLLIFALLCWYRLSIAVALLPLALPYYLQQKTVIGNYSFSIAEITLATCVGVALLQFALQRGNWRYHLSWNELRDRLGPFALPIGIFLLAAGVSVLVAYEHHLALRAFREEVFEPILYLLLAMFCLRSRQDLARLLLAMLASGLVVAFLGMAQYFVFRSQLVLESDGIRRVHAMYGSANSIGLLFDYVLPIALALILVKTWTSHGILGPWWIRVGAIAICMPMLLVLYLSQSRGAWVAIAIAFLFMLALSIRNRRVLLGSGLVGIVILGAVFLLFHEPLLNFIVGGHLDAQGISTVTKRLFLWQSALRMIHDHLWFGVGMENWLCYYSYNTVCFDPALILHHYWILHDPVTGAWTGLQNEPTLSHPHNIFLHVWVSMGIFGVLAFIAVLALFFWLFARILLSLRNAETKGDSTMWWMTMGVGAAMVAALIQGQVDSSFLVQDLSFCFWMLVTAILLLRMLTGTPWRGRLNNQLRPFNNSTE